MTAPVCFLHVSKTSGTSVTFYLESQFSTAEVCQARTGGEFAELGLGRLAEFRMFRAECDASVVDLLPPATAVVTMLRDPLARASSHWQYIRRIPEHGLYQRFQGARSTFECFANEMPPNAMARLLAARPRERPHGLWEQRDAWDDEELLDRALARLESFAVVGLTEAHDESVALIAHAFGWAPPRDLPRTNAAPSHDARAEPSAIERELFAEHNAVDAEVYAAAVRLFERRRRLADVGVRTARYEDRLAARSRPLDRRLVVDVTGPFSGAGWMPVIDTDWGRMRPIGASGRASIDLPVTVGRFAKLEITCPAVSGQKALETLVIEVDGAQLPHTVRSNPEGVTITAALPPSGPQARFTQITLSSAGGVPVPAKYDGAPWDVATSLAVSRVELTPYRPSALRYHASADGDGRHTSQPRPSESNQLWQNGPTWTVSAELQQRLDHLDLWRHVEDLQRNGFAVVPEIIEPDVVQSARAALCRLSVGAIQRTRRRSVQLPLRHDRLFADLLLHPVQLALADAACGMAMVCSQLGMVRDRTSNPLALHAENALWLAAPYPNHHYVCSTLLTLDEVDEARGGTCFVPGSHLTKGDPPPGTDAAVVTPRAPAGSLIVWLGGTWHGAVQRTAPGERVSLLTIFTRPSLRPTDDLRGLSDTIVDSEEMRLRLRRADPFDHEGVSDSARTELMYAIRNIPREGSVTCDWFEAFLADDELAAE